MAIISVSEKIVEKHYREIKMTLEKGASLRTVYKMLRFALPYLEFKRIVEEKYPAMLEAVKRGNMAGRIVYREGMHK